MKRRIISIVLLGILILLVVVVARSKITRALVKSTDHFIVHEIEPHVFYEPGAEANADSIAAYLPKALERVESDHGRPFTEPVRIFVCESQESLNEYIAHPWYSGVRGASVLGKVFISPLAFFFHGRDTHRETLIHELSHLHIRQKLGYFGYKGNIPVWFHEGLANTVARMVEDQVTMEDAAKAILSGYHFVPDDRGTRLAIKQAPDYGLDYPMFHCQSGMFVMFMRDRDKEAFDQFLSDIQEGESFAASFELRFGVDVLVMWEEFVSHLDKTYLPG
jgi:hypothetical protein